MTVILSLFSSYLRKIHKTSCSPSLFNAPSTPKQNSGKLEVFEWTIEDLSSFNPVNVVAHETQFRDDMDPEREAQVQAAISSFFSEHQIVPSPKMCKQKFELSNIYNSTAIPEASSSSTSNNKIDFNCHIAKINKISDKSVRENSTQTAITFPPSLPKEIEDLFKRFQVNENEKQPSYANNDDEDDINDKSMMDISTLRRKLFIKPPESPEMSANSCTDDTFAIHLSPAPRTPQLRKTIYEPIIDGGFGCDNSLSSDMFGELSPIAMPVGSFDCSSPLSSSMKDISMISDGKKLMALIEFYLKIPFKY